MTSNEKEAAPKAEYPVHGVLPYIAQQRLRRAAGYAPNVARGESPIRMQEVERAIVSVQSEFPNFFIKRGG